MGAKKVKSVLLILSLLPFLLDSAKTCEISTGSDDYDIQSNYVFYEVDEDYEVGKMLPGPLSINLFGQTTAGVMVSALPERSLDGVSVTDYIKHEFDNETNAIKFFLVKSLRDYHLRKWTPTLEYNFRVDCSEDPYTYMISIKDANLNSPTFSSLSYKGSINLTFVQGFQLSFRSENGESSEIEVNDADFNFINANVSLACEGSYCTYFTIQANHKGFVPGKGHSFNIEIRLKESEFTNFDNKVKNGEEISFDLLAKDPTRPNLDSSKSSVYLDVSKSDSSGSQFSSITMIVSGVVVAAVLMSCAVFVLIMYHKNRAQQNILRKLTEAEIREFYEGAVNFSGRTSSIPDVNTPIVMSKKYNRKFEIPREDLRIDETTVLGTGAYGVVWKGSIVYSNGESRTVAIKTVKKNLGILYFKALLSEVKIMVYIGHHPNIVSLVGACTSKIRKREVFLAMEYCENGNFLKYLKRRRTHFKDLRVAEENLQLTDEAYTSYISTKNGGIPKFISTLDLLRWASQIANGLYFLEKLEIVHGDVASRNVLIDGFHVAKIGDFGLSRRLIDYSNYYRHTKPSKEQESLKFPLKWMAPESLKDLKFSHKSDIWSFGIVLYEIFTLGEIPYPGISCDENFLGRLEKGMRPSKPQFATTFLYDMMLDCWNFDPAHRPSIFDLKRALENMTTSLLNQRSDTSYVSFIGGDGDDDGYLRPVHSKRNINADT